MTTQHRGFDRKSALARVGGDAELLQELADLFLTDYPRSLAALHVAIDARDPLACREEAHGLKGAVANFGAAEAVEAALRLEMLGREGHFEGAPAALSALEQALATLHHELLPRP